jgi:cyanophycin synthetase
MAFDQAAKAYGTGHDEGKQNLLLDRQSSNMTCRIWPVRCKAHDHQNEKMRPWELTDRLLTVHFSFEAPDSVDLSLLDDWLSVDLGIPDASFACSTPAGESPDLAQAKAFLSRTLALARLFLELGRVPIFELPTITSVALQAPGKAGFLAQVGFPLIDNLASACCQLALQSSLDLCRWALKTPRDPENGLMLYAGIEEKVIKPLRRMVPAGKSTIPVLRAAHSLGIPFIHLGLGVYQLGWGSKARRMDRSTSELDSAMGSKLSQNKVVTASLLRMAGLPAPSHLVVNKTADAVAAAGKIGFPVVVKPSDRDRGEGVAVDVIDDASLQAAFEVAQKLARNKQVIVERQVPGVCHRLFVANGKLLYAVKRLPMSVRGDGKHTVAQLVDAEVQRQRTQPPWRRTEIRPVDGLAVAAMKRDGVLPESVPDENVMVPLRRIESTAWGGIDEEVSDRIHPDNLAIAIRAAELFGLHVAGIDIITPDITVPWHVNGAIINEVNFAPLFGGGEISRRYIPIFLKELIDGQGRIPIEVFEGQDAAGKASQMHAEMAKRGLRCFLTTRSQTLDAKFQELKMASQGISNRVRALLCRPEVDAIVVVRIEPGQR